MDCVKFKARPLRHLHWAAQAPERAADQEAMASCAGHAAQDVLVAFAGELAPGGVDPLLAVALAGEHIGIAHKGIAGKAQLHGFLGAAYGGVAVGIVKPRGFQRHKAGPVPDQHAVEGLGVAFFDLLGMGTLYAKPNKQAKRDQ